MSLSGLTETERQTQYGALTLLKNITHAQNGTTYIQTRENPGNIVVKNSPSSYPPKNVPSYFCCC